MDARRGSSARVRQQACCALDFCRSTDAEAVSSRAGFDDEFARALGMDLRTLRQSLAAVAEFKGETWNHGSVVGVVRFVQVRAGRALVCLRCTT